VPRTQNGQHGNSEPWCQHLVAHHSEHR
jgi:hypothetical protein